MATEINPLIIPFDSLLVTRSKREYRETVQGWGEEPCELEGLDGVTTAVRGKGVVIWVSKKLKGCELYGLAAHEATHAACDMLDMIGEDALPSRKNGSGHSACGEKVITRCS